MCRQKRTSPGAHVVQEAGELVVALRARDGAGAQAPAVSYPPHVRRPCATGWLRSTDPTLVLLFARRHCMPVTTTAAAITLKTA